MKHFLIPVLILLVVAMAAFAGDITANGMNQGDLYTFLSRVVTGGNSIKTEFNLSQAQMYNRTLDYAGVASLPGAASIQVIAFDYAVNGVSHTQASAALSMSSTTEVSAGKFNVFLFSISAAGTATATAGTSATTAGAVTFPTLPSAHAPFGYLLVKASSGATFTLGTDEFGEDCDITQFNSITHIASDSGGGVATLSFSDLSLTGL